MPEHSPIQAYLETVASQIRWKRARPVVTQELARHLEDQRDAFAAEGRENAEQMAVAEMGDPVKLGVELDSLHRPAPQYGLLALTILFALSGAVLRIWLTADWASSNLDADPEKTLLAWGLGCAALLLGYFLDGSRLAVHGRSVYMVVGNLNTVVDMWLIGLALSVFRGKTIARDQACDGKPLLPRYRITIQIRRS